MHSGLYLMAKEIPESTRLMKNTGRRADSSSMHDHEFPELVWENGRVVVKSLPSKIRERPKFGTVDPAVLSDDNFYRDKKKLHDANLAHNNSLQDNELHESFYQAHLNLFLEHINEGSPGYDKNLIDSQIVPVNEYANPKLGGAFDHHLSEIPKFATRNSQPHDQPSLQQYRYQASSPFKRPRVGSSTNIVSAGELMPNSKLQEQDLESDRTREKTNFSLFLRSPLLFKGNSNGQRKDVTVPTNCSKVSSGAKELKYNIDEGFGNPVNSMDINMEVSPASAKPPTESIPDDQSEAVRRDGEFTANKKLMSNTGKCSMEPRPVASSSLCSHGASNNPIYNNFKRRYHEDTDGSADRSYQNVEEKYIENARKKVPGRGGDAGNRRKWTAEVHNQSERKRRDKINKKMRELQELIPNCNKVDKALMLDEAMEYLKSLQLQVQMMSMGAGICIPQMMIPAGMQQMHAPQMAHFSPMGVGVGLGTRMHMMGRGAVGCTPQFMILPVAAASAVPLITQNRIQMPGFAAQPLLQSMSMFHPPLGLFNKTVPVAAAAGVSPDQVMGSAKLPNHKHPNQMNNAKPSI